MNADQDRQARIARVREELLQNGKLKHRPGPSYCVVCGCASPKLRRPMESRDYEGPPASGRSCWPAYFGA